MNEELQTVKAEIKIMLDAVGAAHNDLENLVVATEVGSLFLDPKVRIRMFMPRISQTLNLTEIDVGRPITDFAHHMAYGTLVDDAKQMMRTLVPVEQEFEASGVRKLLVRLRPYRTIDD